jgi:hypothetical protein
MIVAHGIRNSSAVASHVVEDGCRCCGMGATAVTLGVA